MNDFDIERLKQHNDVLKEIIIFDDVKPHLKINHVFSSDMLEHFDSVGTQNSDKNGELLRSLPKRGPRAYTKFVKSLVDSNQIRAAKLLCDSIPDAGEWHGSITRAVSIHQGTSVYPMEKHPRGLALILSNTEFENDTLPRRLGGEIDEINLKRLFDRLGFEVQSHPNKSKDEALSVLTDFQSDTRHLNADACVIGILSHGNEDGFYTFDGKTIKNEDMLEMFNNVNCAYLRHKPKLFFLQHCRGDNVDMGVVLDSVVTDAGPSRKTVMPSYPTLPAWSDMMICYSTSPKYVSLRSEENGTWFILTLVKVFSERAHDTSLDELLMMVAANMMELEACGWKQSPEIKTRGWRRRLYFNPGL